MEDKNYRQTKSPINSTLTVVQDNEYKWGAIDEHGNVVIPFGKYAWIDGFQNGLAKVIGFNDTMSPNLVAIFDSDLNEVKDRRVSEQGIVNESGEEVPPLKYNRWKSYGKDYPTIKYFKGEEEHTVSFQSLNPSLEDEEEDNNDDYLDCLSIQKMMRLCNPKIGDNRYRKFEIPKKSGGVRTIFAQNGNLKWMQLCLNEIFKAIYTPSPYAIGFAEGRSIVNNAEKHLNQNYVFNIDLSDFSRALIRQEYGDVFNYRHSTSRVKSQISLPDSVRLK